MIKKAASIFLLALTVSGAASLAGDKTGNGLSIKSRRFVDPQDNVGTRGGLTTGTENGNGVCGRRVDHSGPDGGHGAGNSFARGGNVGN